MKNAYRVQLNVYRYLALWYTAEINITLRFNLCAINNFFKREDLATLGQKGIGVIRAQEARS